MSDKINDHARWFENYAARKIGGAKRENGPMLLKLEHSRRVLANARRVTALEGIGGEMAEICHLSALYHDIGRFDQYLEYGTFRDRESCDHGRLGVRIVKREGRLAGETAPVRHAVLAAIGLHNRFRLPDRLKPEFRLACEVTRDSDKLDILLVMDEHLSAAGRFNSTVVLSLPDDDGLFAAEVIKAAMEKRVAAYSDLRSVNDFRLLLGTWFFDLHSQSARRAFLEDGHARGIVEALPGDGPYAQARDALLRLFDAAGRG